MSIKSGQIIPLIAVTDADATLLAASGAGITREVYRATLHNTTAGAITVELFLSADAASGAGERFRYYSVDANSQKSVEPFGIPAATNLLSNASAAGLYFEGLYTQRDGEDA